MDILIKVGDGMHLTRIFLIILIFIITLQGDEMQKIEKVWDDIEAYWKKYDSKMVIGKGDSQKDIDTFEKKYNVQLPKELVYSLKINYQKSRQGRKALTYPWFGTNVGIDLLSIDEIEENHIFYTKYSGLEDTELPHISTIFIGNMLHYDAKIWQKKWIPIIQNTELEVVCFLDLDNTSKNYQKVIGFYQTDTKKDGDHFRFAYIADNYVEFINNLKNIFLEYQKQTGDEMEITENGSRFDSFYYRKIFNFPNDF